MDYRVLPDSVVRKALGSDNASVYGSGLLESLLGEGWVVIEVDVTLENYGQIPVVIEAGGPYCYWPFGEVYAPIDYDASLYDIRGRSEEVYHYCQLALIYVDLLPGESHVSKYYFAITTEYEGRFSVEAKLCSRQHNGSIGGCCTYSIDAPIVVGQDSGGG